MCQVCAAVASKTGASTSTATAGRQALKEISPREREEIREFVADLTDELEVSHQEIIEKLRDGTIDLSRRGQVGQIIRRVFESRSAEFRAVFGDMHVGGAEAGRELAIQRFELDAAFELTDDRVIQALRESGFEASRQTTQRMVGDITEALVDAYQEGMSVPDIADRLQNDVFEDMRGWEARRIARTEVISGSNRGSVTAYRDASSVVGKEWLATPGPRTRPTHIEADGQVVPLDAKFVVGGARADHPGDSSLPADERINCRCTTVPVFDASKL